MTFSSYSVPMEDDLLQHLAGELITTLPGSATGDFSRAVVVLPSSRACVTLGHVLLESSAADTLLLPKTLTLTQLAEELAVALNQDPRSLPTDKVRPLILAPQLQKEPWLQDRPESAPGLANEFLTLFDEVRLHGLTEIILGDGPMAPLTSLVHSEAAADLEKDLHLLRRVWRLYRQQVPADQVDWWCRLADPSLLAQLPDSLLQPDLFLVAGFANLDPTRASLLRNLADRCADSRLFLPRVEGELATFFASTWDGNQPQSLDPLAPSRLVAKLLIPDEEPDQPLPSKLTLREKVAALKDPSRFWVPAGPLEMLACGTSEHESRVIADRVVGILGAEGGSEKKTAIVTNDPVLAARIVAQLRDAGVDADQTLGAPLSSLPAGLLLRFLLRAVLTDFQPDALLEVITHPYVKKQEYWNLRLEKLLRGHQGGRLGADGLLALARNWDEAAQRINPNDRPGLTAYVDGFLKACQPLTQQTGNDSWSGHLTAVTEAWNALCPGYPLVENKESADVGALARLLEDLALEAHRLPQGSLADLTADLGRLMAAENVAPHRSQAKPVLVAGLVEARLEKFDHLILAGLAEGSFPARRQRPLFLTAGLRQSLGLPNWRQAAARDSALFLRLLFNAPRVLITWPNEQEGRPALPSGFVERLALASPQAAVGPEIGEVPLWRKSEDSTAEILLNQKEFSREGLAPVATEMIRPLNLLSWSALRMWRECPYRFLLARGFQLAREEEIREEFGRRDYGSLVHRSLWDFLQPESPGYAALLGGHEDQARQSLMDSARRVFLEPGAATVSQSLWLAAFEQIIPSLVACELERFQQWRPILLEHEFELSVTELLEWLAREKTRAGLDLDLPPAPVEPVILRGTIDRVDQNVLALESQEKQVMIIDYKTGTLPSAQEVAELIDLQILLYALAVEVRQPQWRVTEGCYYEVTEKQIGPSEKTKLSCADDSGRAFLAEGALVLAKMALTAADPQREFALIPAETKGEGAKELPCRYCEFRGVCRVEERPGLPGPTVLKLDHLVNRKEGGW